ncbi:hypothetical protein XELAEV_18018685mg [Xenopus laevis]|uniref:Uncharacterized protein n=1 Tax=Xenopus laevis TaxID=8355 RepID=A0A974DEM4_XENLA|nr:hypothetical protein XELAEV_18018685mg [Xenopus laevis]
MRNDWMGRGLFMQHIKSGKKEKTIKYTRDFGLAMNGSVNLLDLLCAWPFKELGRMRGWWVCLVAYILGLNWIIIEI